MTGRTEEDPPGATDNPRLNKAEHSTKASPSKKQKMNANFSNFAAPSGSVSAADGAPVTSASSAGGTGAQESDQTPPEEVVIPAHIKMTPVQAPTSAVRMAPKMGRTQSANDQNHISASHESLSQEPIIDLLERIVVPEIVDET